MNNDKETPEPEGVVTEAAPPAEEERPFIEKSLDQLEDVLPETTKLIRGLSANKEYGVRRTVWSVLELLTVMFAAKNEPATDPWAPPPIDQELMEFYEVTRLGGLDAMEIIGGGIFGAGAPLEQRETVTGRLLEHLKRRVKESYDKGVADGREAILRELSVKAPK